MQICLPWVTSLSTSLNDGHHVTTIDNSGPFYLRAMNEKGIAAFPTHSFTLIETDICNASAILQVFHSWNIDASRTPKEIGVGGPQSRRSVADEPGIDTFVYGSLPRLTAITTQTPLRRPTRWASPSAKSSTSPARTPRSARTSSPGLLTPWAGLP